VALASAASLLLAGSCCLPLGTVLAAAGLAGAASAIDSAYFVLMPLAVLMSLVAVWQAFRMRRCARPSRARMIVALASVAVVFGSLLFPHVLAGILADWITP
jgi:hypothetical protein